MNTFAIWFVKGIRDNIRRTLDSLVGCSSNTSVIPYIAMFLTSRKHYYFKYCQDFRLNDIRLHVNHERRGEYAHSVLNISKAIKNAIQGVVLLLSLVLIKVSSC